MQHLFLTSSVGTPGVATSIRTKLTLQGPLRTAFVTTPVELPSEQKDLSWLDEDRAALNDAGFATFDYTITGKSLSQIQSELADIDVLYVSGGNTRYLLMQSQLSNFTSFVREFVATGKPYIGTSAGSIIAGPMLPKYLWGEEEEAPSVTDFHAYNLVNATLIPHWGSNLFRDLYLGGRIQEIYNEQSQPFILCNDYEYVEVVGDELKIIDVRIGQ